MHLRLYQVTPTNHFNLREAMTEYQFQCESNTDFDNTISRVSDALKAEGFGILTEIDVKSTFKQKLDVDIPPYRILGACNPPFAQRALEAEPDIGVLLPCNVAVREDGNGAITIVFMDPNVMADLSDSVEIHQIVKEIRERLIRVRNSMI